MNFYQQFITEYPPLAKDERTARILHHPGENVLYVAVYPRAVLAFYSHSPERVLVYPVSEEERDLFIEFFTAPGQPDKKLTNKALRLYTDMYNRPGNLQVDMADPNSLEILEGTIRV